MRLQHTCGECRAPIATPRNESQNRALRDHWNNCDAAIARGIRYTQAMTHTDKGEDIAKRAESRIAARA